MRATARSSCSTCWASWTTWRTAMMMGGYVLYYRGKVIGGIYRGDRFLLKVTPASERLLPEAPRAIPYEGAKEMLLVEVEDRDVLRDVVDAMWEELPAPKKRNKK